jgi:ureidoglycolate dehydrogenase (NAD+)
MIHCPERKNDMERRVAVEELRRFCVEALVKAGLQIDDAGIVADVLVMTDTWGTFSHGTGALRNYLNAMRAGGIDSHGKAEVVTEGDSWAVIDGHSGMGMLGCCLAMNTAIEKARKHTIAWAGVRNSSHFGASGYYANMAVRHDMLGIAMSNADPNMVVPGGRGHVIGNNPIAYAVPASKEHPILLDIALSAVAAGKIFSMKAQRQPIPSNWLTDADGLPTTESGDWPATGSMMPMAGHKGYGIALLVEVVAGLITSAGMLDEVNSWVLKSTEKSHLGQAFIAINVGNILPIEGFKHRVDEMIRKIHEAPRAKNSQRICVPGEIEWEHREDALKNGIPLPELTLNALYGTGEDMDLDTRLFEL